MLFYINSVYAYGQYHLADQVANNPSWRLQDENGNDATAMGMHMFNHSVHDMATAFIETCYNSTLNGCDGCFLDRSASFYQPPGINVPMSDTDARVWRQAHFEALNELNGRLVAKGHGTPIALITLK